MIATRIDNAINRLMGIVVYPGGEPDRDTQISDWINKMNAGVDGFPMDNVTIIDPALAGTNAETIILNAVKNVNLWDLVHNGTSATIAPTPAILNGDFDLHVGANSSDYLAVDVLKQIQALNAGVLAKLWTVRTNNAFATRESIDRVNAFLDDVNDLRAALGAFQNRLEFTVDNLDISAENLSASESRIRDADMAKEMMNLTATNILQQAATAMLAQANQAPQSVLQLLQ